MPKVSIIVPVYNAEKTLHRCLDSLVSQTYDDIEILLVNDGSTDNSQMICEEYKNRCTKIILINQENSGPATARNTGIDNATGKYIAFSDADDHVESTMIEEMVRAAESNQAEMVICGYDQESHGKVKIHKYSYEPGLYEGKSAKKIAIDLINDISTTGIPPYSWVRMILREKLNMTGLRFATGMVRSEDYFFIVQLHFCVDRVYLNGDKPLYHYMDTNTSITHSYVKGYWASVKKIYLGLSSILPEREDVRHKLDAMLIRRSLIALNNETRCKDSMLFKKNINEIAKDKLLNSIIRKIHLSDETKPFSTYCILMKLHMRFIVFIRYFLKYRGNRRLL